MQDEDLLYYNREMEYLRRCGETFAQKHPNVAGQIAYSSHGSTDPHIERLLQSFAFLTGRLNRSLEQKQPLIAHALLRQLVPALVDPIPSMAIARLDPDASLGKLTGEFIVPKGTSFREKNNGTTWQSAYELSLWPLVLKGSKFIYGQQIYIDIEFKVLAQSFSEIKCHSICLYLGGDVVSKLKLYAALADLNHCFLSDGENTVKADLTWNGLTDSENILIYPKNLLNSYRLLQECFNFAEKFFFFTVDTTAFNSDKKTFILRLPLKDDFIMDEVVLNDNDFQLNCVPLRNIFVHPSEPIRLDYKSSEYLLMPDANLNQGLVIHDIQKVDLVKNGVAKSFELSPYFSFDHYNKNNDIWWIARRPFDDEHHDLLYLAFVNKSFTPDLPNADVVYAHVCCSNGILTKNIQIGGELKSPIGIPVKKIRFITKPSDFISSVKDGESLWNLVSELSLNHIQIEPSNFDVLKQRIHLYARHHGNKVAVQELLSMRKTNTSFRLGDQVWKGFVPGIEISLDFLSNRGENVLLTSVLFQVFRNYLPTDHFLKVNCTQNNRTIASWKPIEV